MKKKLLLLLMTCLMLSECKFNSNAVISDEEFVDILCDLHILGVSYQSLESADSIYAAYWSQIETKYGHSEDEIKAGYDRLKADPIRLRETYEQVVDKLNTIQNETYNHKFK